MGGAGAPDSLTEAPKTQTWLAVSNDREALVTGKYFYHKKPQSFHPAAADVNLQDSFFSECERLSGISFPL
jgi:hypothetical protein